MLGQRCGQREAEIFMSHMPDRVTSVLPTGRGGA